MKKFLNVRTPFIGAGGRLSVVTATPILATGNNIGTIFYTPYNGDYVPIVQSDGSIALCLFTELSNVLANSATGKAGPAAAANNSNYDLFVWDDAGTLRLTRGPAWTSDTARGTGAGTTELQRNTGLWTNKVAITNGPGAGLGTLVGTIRTNGTATTDFSLGGTAAGGTAALLNVWNAFNRVDVRARVIDSNTGFTYTTATYRSLDNSNGNRISFVNGAPIGGSESHRITGGLQCSLTSAAVAGAVGRLGIGADSTTSAFVETRYLNQPAAAVEHARECILSLAFTSVGFHFLQALECGDGANATTYNNSAMMHFTALLNL